MRARYRRDQFTRVHREPCAECEDEGDWIIACAFDAGYIEGFVHGFNEGSKEGFREGFKEGFKEGRKFVQSTGATTVVLTPGKPKEN